MKEIAQTFFHPETDEQQIKDVLVRLHSRGETAEELAGVVDAMMERAVPYPSATEALFDICGTGGDKSGTFNISTTTAFVLAGAGVKVAKHGNRSISSKSGSADVLAALGLSLNLSPVESLRQLEDNGLAFLFAPEVHPAMGRIQPLRKSLGQPTLFNLIGPLANPFALESQMIGVYKAQYQEILAEAAHLLGRKRAVIVTGQGSLDEASLEGTTTYSLLNEGKLTTHTFTAQEIGQAPRERHEILGGEAIENAMILRRVLQGQKSAYYDTTLVNAGLALVAAERASSIEEGIKQAEESIQSGRAFEKLNRYPSHQEVSS